MSDINCSACSELKQYAPDFAANGVTEAVCDSLHEDTGFNPDSGHNNEEDLHNANDCLIGNLVDTVEAYEVCDWKDFMKNFGSNLYETLKAIICGIGGMWARVDALCEQSESYLKMMNGNLASLHAPVISNKITCPTEGGVTYTPSFQYRIDQATACTGTTRTVVTWTWYVHAGTTVTSALAVGDTIAQWNISDIVAAIGQSAWNKLRQSKFSSIGFWVGTNTLVGCIFDPGNPGDTVCKLNVEAINEGPNTTGSIQTYHPVRLYIEV